MVDKESFESLMREVVASSIPEELIAYDVEGGDLVNRIYEADGNYREAAAGPDETPEPKFYLPLNEIVEGVKFISVLLGTYKTIKELTPKRPGPAPTDSLVEVIGEKWALELVASGLSKKKAEEISSKFRGDLRHLIAPPKS